MHLFESLQDMHKLGPHEALLLQCAAILHEVGSYISPRLHHKHSQYIILNSEIFGLDRLDITLVALIARYHRHSTPRPEHQCYADLKVEDRIRVCKLASILRVADALERTHHQRVHEIGIVIRRDKMILKLKGINDVTVEQLAMQSKADLFTQTFGLQVAVEAG
jgi:exopolyphosphatase/guanosine-5'-triphosphate,3'-diphosphate pyrophosphatase